MSADSYFCWLLGLIKGQNGQYLTENYQKLLWKLFVTDYIYELLMDKNRAADGLYLRQIFGRETGDLGFDLVDLSGASRCCNMLEMLIALARDTEDNLMFDPDFGDRTADWFWLFIRNLGLEKYDDCHWFEPEIDSILDRFIFRKYGPDGSFGGMFVVKNSRLDMRKTDLWLQLNAWFEENFPVGNW